MTDSDGGACKPRVIPDGTIDSIIEVMIEQVSDEVWSNSYEGEHDWDQIEPVHLANMVRLRERLLDSRYFTEEDLEASLRRKRKGKK